MDLTPEQVDAAAFVGVAFPRATPDQVHRLSMQRKVFRIDGEAVLATRDGSLFETAAALGRLITEGERQSRELVKWQATRPPEVDAPAPPAVNAQMTSIPLPDPEPAAGMPRGTRPEPSRDAATRSTLPARKAALGERWLTAGAERRGRAARHWSRLG